MKILTAIAMIMGALASLTIFLYMLPLLRGRRPRPERTPAVLPDIVIGKCPVCGSELTVKDKLFTRTYSAEPRDKIYVKGCSKCFDPRRGARI